MPTFSRRADAAPPSRGAKAALFSGRADEQTGGTDHRNYRPGRQLSGRTAARKRLRRPRRQTALVIVQYRSHRSSLSRSASARIAAFFCTTAISPTPPISSASCRKCSRRKSTISPRRATCRSASRRRNIPPMPTRSAPCACSRAFAFSACKTASVSIRRRRPNSTAMRRKRRRARRRRSIRAAPTRRPSFTPIGSPSIIAKPTACMPRTASCSTTKARAAARPS